MKKISKLKNGLISRNLGMAKLALKTGLDFYRNPESNLKAKLKSGFEGHVQEIVSELGIMKGSLMKAGQMLSIYSGAFLPPEAQKILKLLENQSFYLDWENIKEQIPTSWPEQIQIQKTPMAAASLGQVHIAIIDGEKYAMKIQYQGVKKAIKNDIR